jgi:hypothetical protein
MMKRRIGTAWILAAFAFVSLATVSVAQVQHGTHPVVPAPSRTTVPATIPPLPMQTPRPLPTLLDINKSRYVGRVEPGTRVPLSRLPRRPFKSMMNTAIARQTLHGGHYHPFSASGASLTVTATAGCASGGTVGTIYNVGCQLSIQATNMNLWQAAGTDTYEYFVIAPNTPNVATAIATGAGCATVTWTGNTGPACSISPGTVLATQGVYQFLVYDTTQKVWVNSFFASAGQVFNIQVFADQFHTSEQYQFDTASSGAAYIYLTNVATSDHYVMTVQSTGVNAYCSYMSPAGSAALPVPNPRPTGGASGNSLLCNPTTANVTGVNAPGGSLSLTWAFNPQAEAGLYTVSVFDQTANGGAGAILGTVQVSLTAGGGSLLLTGNTTGRNASPAPFGATGTSLLAWDASTDQSVGGVIALTQQVLSPSKYQWTITDPNGQVVSTPAAVTTASNGTLTNPFVFSGYTIPMNAPGQYPTSVWGLQLYDVTHNSVTATQAFQIVGYHATTDFVIGGVVSPTLNFSGLNLQHVTADLKITNDSNLVYGVGDSFSGIEFTEGANAAFSAFKPPAGWAGGGFVAGVTTSLTSTTGNVCNTGSGCSESVTDSNGGAWTFTNYCSAANSNNPSAASPWDQCVFTLLPVASGTVLPPGASIDVPNLYWSAQIVGGFPCFSTPCAGITTILPTHGLSWSTSSNGANPIAWTPVSFGGIDTGLTLAGNLRFDYQGSRTGTTPTCTNNTYVPNGTQGQSPWLEPHFFQPSFTRADYQTSTPFTLSAPRCAVAAFFITNESTPNGATSDFVNGGAGFPEILIGFPSNIPASQVVVDTLSTATWTKVTCPTAVGSTFACFNGPTINPKGQAGSTSTIFLDMPLTISSFPFQEMTAQAYSSDDVYIPLTNDAGAANSAITAYGYNGASTTSIDSLEIGAFSLNANLMTAAFTPGTVGSGQNPTPVTIVASNASTAADPNPDAIDEIVLEQGTNTAWTISAGSTVTGPTGWALQNTHVAGTKLDYYFGICAAQAGAPTTSGPPQTTGTLVPLTAPYPSPPPCTPAQEANALKPGQSVTINANLVTAGGIAAGSYPFTMYAHGANTGGWTALKSFNLISQSESASVGFQSVGATCPGTTVPTNSLPTIGTASNCFVYTFKNTSSATNIVKADLTIPAFDINGLAATSWTLTGGSPTTNVRIGTITGGVFATAGLPAGCTLSVPNTFQAAAGSSNGQIEVNGCTGFSPGKTLAIEFQATSPGQQADTYQFPSTIDALTTSPNWIGDDQVQESFSVGLTIAVNPSNPGPGGSTPVVSCPTCGFAGSLIDFGVIGNGASQTGTNVVRATVIYNGPTTGTHWTLTVNVTGSNPACTGPAPANCNAAGSTIPFELLTSADKTIAAGGHSNTKCGTITPTQLTLAAVPTSASPMTLSTGTETSCAAPNYYWDTIQNYVVQIGTESTHAQTVTVLYTLIP